MEGRQALFSREQLGKFGSRKWRPSGLLFAGAAWKVRQQEMEGRQAFSSREQLGKSGSKEWRAVRRSLPAAIELPQESQPKERKHPMRREEAAGGEKPDQGMRGERITEHSLETIGSR